MTPEQENIDEIAALVNSADEHGNQPNPEQPTADVEDTTTNDVEEQETAAQPKKYSDPLKAVTNQRDKALSRLEQERAEKEQLLSLIQQISQGVDAEELQQNLQSIVEKTVKGEQAKLAQQQQLQDTIKSYWATKYAQDIEQAYMDYPWIDAEKAVKLVLLDKEPALLKLDQWTKTAMSGTTNKIPWFSSSPQGDSLKDIADLVNKTPW